MRKGIKLKAMFSDEEKSLTRYKNYPIEDLGQDGTVYIKNDNNFVLKLPPNEVRKYFNIEKNDRRRLVAEMLCQGYYIFEIANYLKEDKQPIHRDIKRLKEKYNAKNIWELTHKFTIEELSNKDLTP